jgi:hypothetical protein
MEQIAHTQLNGVVPFPATVTLTPSALLERAVAANAALEVQAQLMAMQDRHAFNLAMAAAQAELPIVSKNQKANFGAGKASYEFADLAEITRIVKPILAKHGIRYGFRTINDEKTVMVECVLSLGIHEETNSLCAPLDFSGSKNPVQALGSTVSYLERYTLSAALGLAAAKDDDGHAATTETITPKQAANIEALAIEAGADMARLLAFCKVATIAEIRRKDFDLVMSLLEAKRAKGERS